MRDLAAQPMYRTPQLRTERRRRSKAGSRVMLDALGWLSSFILVLTIAKQVHKQWREGSSEGVSKWLFIGQIAASLGFTVYSWGVHNWVFVATNAIMLVNAVLGYGIVLRHRRRASHTSPGSEVSAKGG